MVNGSPLLVAAAFGAGLGRTHWVQWGKALPDLSPRSARLCRCCTLGSAQSAGGRTLPSGTEAGGAAV